MSDTSDEAEPIPAVNTATVGKNGPLEVHADIRIDGQPAMVRTWLCRCGASQNKPFCDGSHNALGFADPGQPARQECPELESTGGPLSIRAAPNGPLLVTGNLSICTEAGEAVFRSGKVALCRCGASMNKPFCDGSHKAIGFQAA